MLFWSVVIVALLVVLVVLAGAWWLDHRHRRTDDRLGRRKQLHADRQVNEARAVEHLQTFNDSRNLP
jgi:hypothetical protein